MSGLMEMASVPPWKPELFDGYHVSAEIVENGENLENENAIDTHSDKIIEIPAAKPESTVKRKSDIGSRKTKLTSVNENLSNFGAKPSFLVGENGTDDDASSMGSDQTLNSEDSCFDDNSRSRNTVVTSHLKHVKSNPLFIKGHGVIHPHGHILDYGEAKKSPPPNGSDSSSTGSLDQEYAPFSGFVNKLRQKFSSIGSQQDDSVHYPPKPPKRFGSVDNLIDRPSSRTSRDKTDFVSKSKTVESISKSRYDRSFVPNSYNAKPRKYSDSSFDHTSSTRHVTPRRSKPDIHQAPDIKIGRDDIIIIEHTPSLKEKEKPSQVKKDINDKEMVNKVKPLKDEGEVNEMPKPNIVSSFRSMFEKSSGPVTRKILPDSPKVFTSQRNQTNLSLKPNTQTADIPTSPVSENSVKPSVSVSRENKVAERDVDETANVRPSTMKEKAKETPRLLDSPVTRKKTYPEKKSIFDSDSVITTKKTSPRRFLQSEKNEKREDLPSVNVTSNIESAVQAEKDKKVPATNKSSVTVASSEESMGKEVFPTRMEVFDSSMIAKIPKKSEQRSKVENDDRNAKSQDVLHAKKEVFDSSAISKSKDKKVSKPREEYSEERNKKSEDVVQKRKEIFDSKSTENSGISSKTRSLHGKTKQAPATPLVNSQITEDVNSTQNEVSEITKRAKISSEKENIESKKVQSVPEEKGHKSLNSVQNVPKQNILQNATTTQDVKSTNVEKVESNSSRSDLEPTGSKNNRVQDNEPKKGIPSVIANRLNKRKPVQDNKKDLKNENVDDNGEEVIHSSNLRPSQLKKGTLINGTTSSQQERTALCSFGMSNTTNNKKKSPGAKTEPVSNFDDLIGGKRNSPVPLFDSASSIVPKAKPKPSAQGVPPLDLSDLMPTEKNHPYQEGYIPTKIEPCKLVIVGAPVLLKTTPLRKTRSGHQLKIQFDDSAVQTHEYPREEVALEEYLSTNPAEVEEAKREEQAREEEPPEDPLEGPQIGDIPRQGEVPDEGQETPRKNFTSSLEAGELSKYKPKHQEEFVFGMSLKEPEKAPATEVATETSTEDDLHLRPADEDDLHDFSTHDTSDMLF